MTSKRNIEDRVDDLEGADTDEDEVTDAGLGVTADFVTYENDEFGGDDIKRVTLGNHKHAATMIVVGEDDEP
jgi:hypothetical protein